MYALRRAIGLHMLEPVLIAVSALGLSASGTNGMDLKKYACGVAGDGLMVSGCR